MKRTKKVLVIILSSLLVLVAVAGCSAMKGSRDQTTTSAAPMAPEMYQVENDNGNVKVTNNKDISYHTVAEQEKPAAEGIRGTGFDSNTIDSGSTLDILAQRKVIRNANLSMEVDDFYNAYGNLQAMLTGIGFVQESNIHRDFYNYDEERITRVSGNITIRVDARHFDNILNDLKGLGEVIDDRIYSTDVTDQFYDTEGRLKILKIEYDYLEEYMRSLKDPDSIFKTRMRMTELQTEIERLTGTLNKWSDLVELSTIYIQMEEKYPDEMKDPKKDNYWERLKDSISNSLTGIVEALGDVVIFIIEAIPTLVVLGLIGLFGYRIVRKFLLKKKVPAEEVKKE